jgi:very-short-patch-repair endonuclease
MHLEEFARDRENFYYRAYLGFLALMEVMCEVQLTVGKAHSSDLELGKLKRGMVALNRNLAEARVAAALIAAGDTTHIRQWRIPGTLRASDFAWPAAGVVLEVDGSSHRLTTSQHSDAIKDTWATENDWVMVRMNQDEALKHPEHVATKVLAIVQERLSP